MIAATIVEYAAIDRVTALLRGHAPELETLTVGDLEEYRRELARRADRLVRRERLSPAAHTRRWRGGHLPARARQVETLQTECRRVTAALLERGWR